MHWNPGHGRCYPFYLIGKLQLQKIPLTDDRLRALHLQKSFENAFREDLDRTE
jgi:hypothetical protein